MLRDYQKNPLGYIRNGSVKSREKPLCSIQSKLYLSA